MEPSKKRNNTDLPDFFMKYDDPMLAREHLLKMDPNRPNTVTHFCAVPLDMVAEYKAAPDFHPDKIFWPLKDMTVDRLSKLLTQLGRSRSGMNKKQIIAMIESLDHESVNMEALLEKKTLKKLKEVNSNNKAVMRFVNVMFSPTFQKKFEDINNSKTRADLELQTEKKLFAEISEHINDDTCGYHDELLPCEDATYSGNYSFYINKERIPEEMHPSGKLQKQVTGKVVAQIYADLFRIRKQIIAFMTQSGTHDGATNPWSYVVNAIKKCKLNNYCPFAVFYFYMQCLFHKGIADAHTHVLKESVKDLNFIDGNSSSKASRKKEQDNEFMKSFCTNVGYCIEDSKKMRVEELNERKLFRLSIERGNLKKAIDGGRAKRIKLLKEYRKCTDEFSKSYTMKSMEDLEATLKADEEAFKKLTTEFMVADNHVLDVEGLKEGAFPISEITITHGTNIDASGSSDSDQTTNKGNDKETSNGNSVVSVNDDESDEEDTVMG